MDILEEIKSRRSVRKFQKKEINKEDIDKLLQATMAAPSAIDRRPWEFYVITNEEKLAKIREIMPFGKYESPLIIIPVINRLKIIPFKKELAVCDLSAATENILLEASSLGIGSVWCAVYPDKALMNKIKIALDMPLHLAPFCAIYLGYPLEDDKGKPKDKYDTKNIHFI